MSLKIWGSQSLRNVNTGWNPVHYELFTELVADKVQDGDGNVLKVGYLECNNLILEAAKLAICRQNDVRLQVVKQLCHSSHTGPLESFFNWVASNASKMSWDEMYAQVKNMIMQNN